MHLLIQYLDLLLLSMFEVIKISILFALHLTLPLMNILLMILLKNNLNQLLIYFQGNLIESCIIIY
jgi:hypothetical protein